MKTPWITCDQCKHRVAYGQPPHGTPYVGRYCMHNNLLEHVELHGQTVEQALASKASCGVGWWLPTQACRDIKSLCGAAAKWFEPKGRA